MQIFIDDKQIDDRPVECQTLGDALRHVQTGLHPSHRIVASVKCDGETVAAEDMIRSLKQPLADFDRVDVITSTREALVIDVMTHASQSLEESETQSQEVARLLVEGKSAAAREQLAECLNIWQQVHEGVAKSISMMEIDPETIEVRGVPLIESLGKPREVLLSVRDALVAGDEVLLADILQYEFADVTQSWHAIIARIRQLAADQAEKA